MKHFILMADIKDSRKKNSITLIKKFKTLISELNIKNKKHLLSPLTITLGDEFQGVTDSLSHGIKLIIDIEELLIKAGYNFKLRYVLNYGSIDTHINNKIAYEMLGPGLTEAREKLNELKKSDARFLIKTGIKKKDMLNNAFIIYQNFIDDWKEKDYKIVNAFIEHKDYKEVSEIINFNISSAWRREKSLKIKEYFAIKDLVLSLSETK